MSSMPKILFICRHNSGRSQIAEAYLQRLAGKEAIVESAGLEPAEQINPLVVEVMREEGFELAGKKPRRVFELFQQGRLYSDVVTVCDGGNERCPIFPGITRRWHHPFPDPAAATGDREEQITQVRAIRDEIRQWLLQPPPGDFAWREVLLRAKH